MSHYYSKVDADSLLSLVNASDCVEYFDTSSLVSEMDETEVLNQINEDTIISYLEDKGFKVERRVEYETNPVCFIHNFSFVCYWYAIWGNNDI